MTTAAQLAPRRCLAHDLFDTDEVVVQDATVMAIDLAGFTSLTDRLSGSGTRGTEELSTVLSGYFGSVSDLVAEGGGDPVAFGGDSLSIVFDGQPASTLRAALGVADRIQSLTTEVAPIPTPAGQLRIAVRIGVARGAVATGVASSGRRLLPVHVGPGLDRAHAAQEATVAGAVSVHDSADLERWSATGPPTDGRGSSDTVSTGTPVDVDRLLSPVLLDRLRRGRQLVESHRVITVAFVRFPAVEPQALQPFLAQVARLMKVVDASGGEVVQVSGGDKGIMAMIVLGAPTAHSDDAVRAVHGALELRRLEPRVAVGIATGPVFAALLGSRTRLFPTHWGLAVNVAARLSQRAEPGRILVSGPTWAGSCQHLRQAGAPRQQALKGCGPVVVHEVTGWRQAKPRLTASALPLLVGRAAELAPIERLLDAVADGQGAVLATMGEPGIGKTRMAQEAVERCRTRRFHVVYADVANHPRGHPGGFWRAVVGELLEVGRHPPLRQWLEALTAALPDLPDPLAVLRPLLQLGDSAPQRVAAEAGSSAPELAQATLGRLLRTASQRRPLMLVLENVDRLDEASVGALQALVSAAAGCAAGLLMTRGQEENRAINQVLSTVPTLALAPLNRDDTGLLAEEAWRQSGGGTPPRWLASTVTPRAGGNPLLARVVTLELLARWKPGDPPPAEELVNGSVSSLLVGQVDRLPADARELLTVLAVAQRPCSPQLLEKINPAREQLELREVLARLTSERLVAQAGEGTEETYGLTHTLLRQAVYDATSHAERERLHRRLVGCLEALGADPVEVAEHVHPLRDPELARTWFPSAARAARDSWNLTGALRWLQRLQPLVSGSEREHVDVELLEVLLVAGRANEVLERVDDMATDRFHSLVDTVDSRPTDRLLAARRLQVLAEAAYSCGQLNRTEEVAGRAMALADGLDEPMYQRAGELVTLSRCQQGNLDGAVQAGRALVSRAARTEDRSAQANALAALAVALVHSGQPEAAAQHYEDALVAAVGAGDLVRQVHILSDLAGCAYMTGRPAACVDLLGQAREIADAIGYLRHLALNLNNEAQLRASLGDAYATSCAALAVDRSLELGDLATAADALHTWLTAKPSLAADPALWRRLVDVNIQLERSLEAAAECADLAVVLARSGERDAVGAAARQAEQLASGSEAPAVHRRIAFAMVLAEAHAAPRRSAGAKAHLLARLDQLVAGAELEPLEAAEFAVARWRMSRSETDRKAAVELAHEALAAEPSQVVRSWFRALREPVPAVGEPLPPPVGTFRRRTTRRELEEAMARIEATTLLPVRPQAAPAPPR